MMICDEIRVVGVQKRLFEELSLFFLSLSLSLSLASTTESDERSRSRRTPGKKKTGATTTTPFARSLFSRKRLQSLSRCTKRLPFSTKSKP